MNENHNSVASQDNSVVRYVMNGSATGETAGASWSIQYLTDSSKMDSPGKGKNGINPILYFKYVKSKFSYLQEAKLKKSLKDLEKAFEQATENGQDVLAKKFLDSFSLAWRESLVYAKGIKKFIDRDVLHKYKHKLRDGHISDTMFEDYTRVIPKRVIENKKKVQDVFDGFIIYHYYNDAQKDLKKMDSQEKAKMRDPVLFGIINGSTRLYFVDEWDDEFCDLSFSEMAKVVAEEGTGKLDGKIKL